MSVRTDDYLSHMLRASFDLSAASMAEDIDERMRYTLTTLSRWLQLRINDKVVEMDFSTEEDARLHGEFIGSGLHDLPIIPTVNL